MGVNIDHRCIDGDQSGKITRFLQREIPYLLGGSNEERNNYRRQQGIGIGDHRETFDFKLGSGEAEQVFIIGMKLHFGTQLSIDTHVGHDETLANRGIGGIVRRQLHFRSFGNRLCLLGLEARSRLVRGMELAFHRVELPRVGGSRQLP